MTTRRRAEPKKLLIKVGNYYIRKRDKMFVTVSKRGRGKVEYTTYPELLVWNTTPEAFERGFRPATDEEIDYADPNWRAI